MCTGCLQDVFCGTNYYHFGIPPSSLGALAQHLVQDKVVELVESKRISRYVYLKEESYAKCSRQFIDSCQQAVGQCCVICVQLKIRTSKLQRTRKVILVVYLRDSSSSLAISTEEVGEVVQPRYFVYKPNQPWC